jgi:eukaryotic-like serine/threonine-protein kinase
LTDQPARLQQLRDALADRYRIEGEIGAGGMATVYLAEDLKHRRRVALKVLRPELGAVLGPERFLAEIDVTANLQHPHLLPLFDSGEADGLLFYVMPYVQGESLRARLERERQLPVAEAVRIATAAASALDYAHRHGVVHRDLKPENILLHDGQPLVADFGIALAISNAGGMRVTQTGLSLGTPLYMSPEQATGDRAIDARSDIYSLAAVLYEMLTGEPPHAANTAQAIIARLLTEKPRSIRTARPAVPPHVDAAVQRALEKLPADRFATAQEFSDVLTGRAVLPPAADDRGEAAQRKTARGIWQTAARNPVTWAALALAVFGWGGMLARLRPADPGVLADATVRFVLEPIAGAGRFQNVGALSPDGRSLLIHTSEAGDRERASWLRHLDSRDAQPLRFAADRATFSPDGRSIAYASDGQIYRVDISADTPPVRVSADPDDFRFGMAWIGDQIVLGSDADGLHTVPVAGGEPRLLLPLDSARGEVAQQFPVALLDGETVLYRSMLGRSFRTARIGILSLRTGERWHIDVSGQPIGVIDDLLIYNDQTAIFGVPIDLRRQHVTGAAIALSDDPAGASLSATGTLVHIADVDSQDLLLEVETTGTTDAVMPPRGRLLNPRYSPDGQRILLTQFTDSLTEVWVYDRRTGTFAPLVRGVYSGRAEWSPDGREILFLTAPGPTRELWRRRADGTLAPELVLAPGERGAPAQGTFTPDGRFLVYGTDRGDIWYRAWRGDTTSRPLAAEPSFVERNAHISPDGRWLAYASDETGAFQIYVRPFPGPGPRQAVTVDGGEMPVWTPDGRQIIYVNGDYFEEATIVLEPDFTVSRRRLFAHGASLRSSHRDWDLSPDGSRLLLRRQDSANVQEPHTIVAHNWAAEVRRRRASRSGAR